MKSDNSRDYWCCQPGAAGMALIIVLLFLVLLSALAVAFFTSVTTELKSSRNYASDGWTRRLADSAVQIVIGQITDATTKGIDPGTGKGSEAWATQPGLIRTYGSAGAPDTYYLLYSSNDMVKTGPGLVAYDPTSDFNKLWDQSPATWTDLNAPVLTPDFSTGGEQPRFPIIDPRAFSDVNVTSSTPDPTAVYGDAWSRSCVEGFWYDTGSKVDGIKGPTNSDPAGGTNDQRLPMPVRWIYVLQDGTLIAPSVSSSGVTADFSSYAVGDARRPTPANPIIGRIAFWTDDDSSKLNVNTAAGFVNVASQVPTGYGTAANYAGSFWDTPRFYTAFEYGNPAPASAGPPTAFTPQLGGGSLALCPAVQNEFQRYPGHPATTSLGPVVNTLLTAEQIYGISPRYSTADILGGPGSSNGGTERIVVDNSQTGTIATTNVHDNRQLQPKQDRLYAAVDELLFGAHAGGMNCLLTTAATPGYARLLNNAYTQPGTTAITPTWLERLRFFLTADNRAPELNLWGQPRVTAWPVRSENATEPTGLNVFDNLMVFCSSVGTNTKPTANGRPDTTDTSNGLYRYLFTRREIGANLDSASPPNITAGRDCELPRNKSLLQSYLYNNFLGSGQPIPGFGGNWNVKYSMADEQSILLEIFDYIRCANTNDSTTASSTAKPIPFAPQGIIVPSLPQTYFTGARGPGRMPTLSEATLIFYYAGPLMSPPGVEAVEVYTVDNTGWSHWDPAHQNCRYVQEVPMPSSTVLQTTQGYMRAFLLFSTFDPMQGYAPRSDPGPNPAAIPAISATPKLTIQCTWQSDFSVDFGFGDGAQSLGFPAVSQPVSTVINRAPGSFWGGRNVGGYEGFMHTLMGGNGGKEKIAWANTGGAVVLLTAADVGTTQYPVLDNPYQAGVLATATWSTINRPFTTVPTSNQEYYPFQTDINKAILVPINPATKLPATQFKFNGGHVKVNLLYGSSSSPVQTFDLNFPGTSNVIWPVPQGGIKQLNSLKEPAGQPVGGSADVTTWNVTQDFLNLGGNTLGPSSFTTVGVVTPTNQGHQGLNLWYWRGNGNFLQIGVQNRMNSLPHYQYNTSLQAAWSFATRLAWTVGQGDGHSQDPSYSDAAGTQPLDYNGGRWQNMVQPGDTVRSLLFWDGKGSSDAALSGVGPIKSGDLRLGQLAVSVPSTSFMPHPDWATGFSRACVLRGGDGNSYLPAGTPAVQLADVKNTTTIYEGTTGNHIYLGNGSRLPSTQAMGNLAWGGGSSPGAAVNGVQRSDGKAGDWDTGVGNFPDGPFYNKPDEGNVIYRYWDPYVQKLTYSVPYFTNTQSYQAPGDTFTSASRQLPSAVMFGSLPARVPEGHHWETLCFCPNPAGANHPGNVNPTNPNDPTWPKDHLLLDLFQVPVVEPYPISDPFSTAGKVNLNYRIAPFDYIRRSTALRGALQAVRVTAVGSTLGTPPHYQTYKTGLPGVKPTDPFLPITDNFRLLVDRDQTIKEMDALYNSAGAFKSASQICEVHLIPWQGQGTPAMADPGAANAVATNQATMLKWWASPNDGGLGNGDLTGDNCREKPYADLYPRVTTKSNTFTVHLKVQALRQTVRANPADYATWQEGKDTVTGEYRGSSTIERYLDPADPRIGAATGGINPDKQSLEKLYRFRTVISRKFAP